MGRNNEVFDTECYAISHALSELKSRGEGGKTYTIFSDSQAALSRVQHDRLGPGQALAVRATTTTRTIVQRGNTVVLWWTPSHEGIPGNEHADQAAKRAAEGKEEQVNHEYLQEASLSYMTRVTAES